MNGTYVRGLTIIRPRSSFILLFLVLPWTRGQCGTRPLSNVIDEPAIVKFNRTVDVVVDYIRLVQPNNKAGRSFDRTYLLQIQTVELILLFYCDVFFLFFYVTFLCCHTYIHTSLVLKCRKLPQWSTHTWSFVDVGKRRSFVLNRRP